jgi:hypothetical protein
LFQYLREHSDYRWTRASLLIGFGGLGAGVEYALVGLHHNRPGVHPAECETYRLVTYNGQHLEVATNQQWVEMLHRIEALQLAGYGFWDVAQFRKDAAEFFVGVYRFPFTVVSRVSPRMDDDAARLLSDIAQRRPSPAFQADRTAVEG